MQQATLDLIEHYASDWNLPQFSYGLIHAGEKHLGAFKTPADTAFPIASITKTFTAYTLLHAKQQGLLNWDDPVRKHLSNFRLHDKDAAEKMTLRDLLCHRSGLPPHTWAWVYSGCTRNEFIQTRLPHLASIGSFGDRHAYSNIGYAILGAVIETTSGKPWEEYLNHEVLCPLGMTQTQHLNTDWHKQISMAQPFALENGSPISMPPFHAEKNHPIAPASELASTGPDLIKWLEYHLNTSEISELFKPLIPINEKNVFYGMGWRIDHGQVWHSGSCSGYSSLIALRPDKRDGLFFLTNTHGITTELRELSKALFNLWDGTSPTSIDFNPTVYAEPQQGLEKLYQLNGAYENPGYGHLELKHGHVIMNGFPMGQVRNTPENQAELVFQDYNLSLPIENFEPEESLEIPFEPSCPAIVFQKKA